MDNKTIILSGINGNEQKAVLNFEKRVEGYGGNLRLYNFKEEPSGILTLAFLVNKEVVKAALSPSGKSLYSFVFEFEGDIQSFSCALVSISQGNATPLLLGSTEGKLNDFDNAFSKNFNLLDKTDLSYDEAEAVLDKAGIDYADEEKKEIEKAIESNMSNADKCASCSYRNAFYGCNWKEENCKQEDMFEEPELPKINTAKSTFYDEIKGQLSLLFERYPEETFLNEIIPSSKWVKVDYENNGQYFVIGLMYEDNEIAYVCYGMPGEYSVTPPREFAGLSQWLPLDPEKPNELGYWIMYQDAQTGENVEIKIS